MLINDMDILAFSGYKDFVWAVELHRFGLEMIGLWPKNDKSKRRLWSKLHTGIILILLIFVCNVPMIYEITYVWGDMVLVINNLQTTLPFVIASVKYCMMQWKRTVLLSIVNMMAEDWMTFKSDIERDVMIRRARTARFIMTIGYVLGIIGVLVLTVPPYFNKKILHETNFTDQKKRLPLYTYHFYDTDKSPQFELTFFIHTVTLLSAGIAQMAIDIFLTLIILHICGQLENFRYRLIRLVSCKNFNKTLNDIVARHLRLIRFADNIENTYSSLMLILILHFSIVFCLSGFLCTIVFIDRKIDEAITEILYSTLIVIALLMNTFLYCGAGELVTEQNLLSNWISLMLVIANGLICFAHVFIKCNAVHRAIYDLEWHKLESKKARNLILLMIRANHPFHITAGKIIPLTMATFCSVLKTSTGYISFLLTKHG